jgi:hypothetical protein
VQNRQNLDRRLISQKSRDLLARFPNNPNNELFSNGLSRAPGPRTVDQGRSSGAPWTHRGADRGQSSPAGAHNGEGSKGNSAQVSPELERQCGGWATVVQNAEVAALGEE